MPICATGGRVVHSSKASGKWTVPINSRKSPMEETKAALTNHSLKIWTKEFIISVLSLSSLLDKNVSDVTPLFTHLTT